jgi:hypothetical protein
LQALVMHCLLIALTFECTPCVRIPFASRNHIFNVMRGA